MSVKKIIDIDKRWEKNIPHNNKSKILFDFLEEYDRSFCNDYFYWKSGGDGDNGEFLMYQLDEYFDSDIYKQHEQEIRKQERQKVIAELEEFENEHRLRARKMIEKYPTENEEQTTRLYGLMNGRLDILENLKQKLNEMKEVRDENLHK